MSNPEKSNKERPLTTEEVIELYTRVRSFLQNPQYRMKGIQRNEGISEYFARNGVEFLHNKPDESDSYVTRGIITRAKRNDGKMGRPGVDISVNYPCSQEQKHEPTPIPENARISISLIGMRERFIIDGTLQGSGISNSFGKQIEQPLDRKPPFINISRKPSSRVIFETYKSYVANMDLSDFPPTSAQILNSPQTQ